MEIQRFVTDVVEAMGGIVEPIEYALCHVMLPEDCVADFDGRTEFRLSFDFDVAQENPDAEFVTFGSYIMDKIMEMAVKGAVSTVRYAVADNLVPANPLEKIKKSIEFKERSNISILLERQVMGIWTVFNFRYIYLYDKKTETARSIWADMTQDHISNKMSEISSSIFYETKPQYYYPIARIPNIIRAFNDAYAFAESEAGEMSKKFTEKSDLNKDIKRINEYYDELELENRKLLERRGLSEQRIRELLSKLDALEIERDKQLNEIKDKYEAKARIVLDNGIMYFVPLVEYRVKIVSRNNESEITVYYNPILKEFSMSQGIVF